MKKILFSLLALFHCAGVFAQTENPAPGVYVGVTGFVDNFTSAIPNWNTAAYGWYSNDVTMYNISQTGNGYFTIAATNADPSYKSIGAYGLNHTFDPIDITANPTVTMVLTNNHSTDMANIRIILRGVHNKDTVDINSAAAANGGGWGTWFSINPALSPGETRTAVLNFNTPHFEHTPGENTRFPNNQCTAASPNYSFGSGACVDPVAIDSIIGMAIWINAGADANTANWPFYAPFTGTVTMDKLIIGEDVTPSLGTNNSSSFLVEGPELYPNPSSKESTLKFSLKKAGMVKVDIRDVTGVQVKNITNEYFAQGDHVVSFDVTTIHNGYYHIAYQFEDGSIYTDKLVIIK